MNRSSAVPLRHAGMGGDAHTGEVHRWRYTCLTPRRSSLPPLGCGRQIPPLFLPTTALRPSHTPPGSPHLAQYTPGITNTPLECTASFRVVEYYTPKSAVQRGIDLYTHVHCLDTSEPSRERRLPRGHVQLPHAATH
ncbi:hypothetical protein E2C01_052591 [Portunus trituberculatus]|uniref:Uncharacterized protein n=1 Tax=Portunus trituberculatus TaxID=210409 RepID=A0A5B7GPS9_PORTR|nr:hypothetical protein [Portunus trituberculatus]